MASGSSNPSASRGHSSRSSSISQSQLDHRPQQPSGLRQSHMPPPSPNPQAEDPLIQHDGVQLPGEGYSAPDISTVDVHGHGQVEEPRSPVNASTSLLASQSSNHGTFFQRPRYRRTYGSFGTENSITPSQLGTLDGTQEVFSSGYVDEPLGKGLWDRILGRATKRRNTNRLAQAHGVRNDWRIYLAYYLPFVNWISQYRWTYFPGDLIAALTMGSFYIPISISYSENIAHIPASYGLYSFCFQPLIYAFFGTSTYMVVGPEAAGSLLVGHLVSEANKGRQHEDMARNARVAGMATALSGAMIAAAGIARLGFLDSVLSRPFLRAVIASIGLILVVSQLIPELGLQSDAEHSRTAHGSSLDQIRFLIAHFHDAHALTAVISFVTVITILVSRSIKHRMRPGIVLSLLSFDRFLVVVVSAILAWQFDWDGRGVQILKDIRSKGKPFQAEWPFKGDNFNHISDAFATGFLIGLLGFLESSVAAKSIKPREQGTTKVVKFLDGTEAEVEGEPDGIKGMSISPNRELLALGLANIVGGVFTSLPAFGGYGRSKVNVSTGGRTPMSSILLSLITFLCVAALLPYFYYIPKATLEAQITVVGISLLEEAPPDMMFFYRISGWAELFLMALVFFTTFFLDLKVGMAMGLIFSVLRLIQHSVRPRIQLLGRVPGTHQFENAELHRDEVESVPNCLIVKFPEPLTFASSASLRDRLKRLEVYGSQSVHPALPRPRNERQNKNIIFDIHGMTSIDPPAAQTLMEIVKEYTNRRIRVFFCRVPSKKGEVWRLMNVSGIVDLCGGEAAFFNSVEEALKATERETTMEQIIGGAVVDEEAAIDSSDAPSSYPTATSTGNGRSGKN